MMHNTALNVLTILWCTAELFVFTTNTGFCPQLGECMWVPVVRWARGRGIYRLWIADVWGGIYRVFHAT